MKFYHILLTGLALASMTTFSACKSDDEKKLEEDNKVLTPAESKVKLETIAKNAMDLLDADDQKPLADLAEYFARNYEDVEMPEEWEAIFDDDEDDYYSPSYVIAHITDAARKGNYSRASTYVENYIINYNDLKGEYYASPNDDCWRKVGNSDKIIFRCINAKGKDVVLTVDGSGEYSYKDRIVDEDYYYTDITNIDILAPTNVKATLVEDGTTLFTTETKYTLDIDGHKVSVTTNTNLCNVNVQATTSGSDNQITETTNIYVDGKLLAASTATINGNKMLDLEAWKIFEDMGERQQINQLKQIFSNASATIDLLGDLTVKASVPDAAKLIAAVTDYDQYDFDEYDFSSASEAERACQNALNAIAETFTANFYYGKSNNAQGTIGFTTKAHEYLDYNYFWIEPIALFKFTDGSNYEFEEYFGGNQFIETRDKFETLLNRYRVMLRYFV